MLALAGLRVLIIVENLPVPFDRRVWQQANALHEAGATVSVICPKAEGYEARYEFRDGIHIHRHGIYSDAASGLGYLLEYGSALFGQTVLAWKIFLTRGFDVLQVCNPPDLGFIVAIPFKIFGRPYIFDHHDINPELFEAKFGNKGWLWKAVSLVERINFLVADVVISTNQSYRAIALERGRKLPENVFIVRSGPDTARFKAVAANPDLKRGRAHMVAYVGVMGEQEGIDLLLAAAAHIVFKHGRTDIGFCLVGAGSSLAFAMRLCDELGLLDYVHFTGRVSDEALSAVLATADVCVNPDRVTPMNDLSTMNKVLEYMAFGKAQVQFEVKEGRISAGDTSLYAAANDSVDFAEKILELIDDPARREAMGRAGRARFETGLSWNQQKPALVAAYHRAMARVRRWRPAAL
jgi:glycosyltransferase involved in cell wall biosynthesis